MRRADRSSAFAPSAACPATSVPPLAIVALLTFLVALCCCCTVPLAAPAREAEGGIRRHDGSATEGTFTLLTYNVAGLPEGISSSHPVANMPLIAERLNGYDLVLVQEDFWYHRELASGARHAWRSAKDVRGLACIGDGLARFSVFRFDRERREAWRRSFGLFNHANDALAPKGFSVAAHQLADDVSIDVYDLHLDAGCDSGDAAARSAQVDQLVSAILARSAGRPLVVAGDFNMMERDPAGLPLLRRLSVSTGLRDCVHEVGVEDDRIDRVFIRSGSRVELSAEGYEVPAAAFAGAAGQPLSDHEPLAVTIRWRRLAP